MEILISILRQLLFLFIWNFNGVNIKQSNIFLLYITFINLRVSLIFEK